MNDIMNLILRVCMETDTQKLNICCTNEIDFSMEFHASQVIEIEEEIQKLKDEGMDAEDNEIVALKKS